MSDRNQPLAAIATAPKLLGARCVGEWEIFDNEHGNAELEEYALNLCHSCPVLEICERWFDSLPRRQRPVGVVAARVVHEHGKAAA